MKTLFIITIITLVLGIIAGVVANVVKARNGNDCVIQWAYTLKEVFFIAWFMLTFWLAYCILC